MYRQSQNKKYKLLIEAALTTKVAKTLKNVTLILTFEFWEFSKSSQIYIALNCILKFQEFSRISWEFL